VDFDGHVLRYQVIRGAPPNDDFPVFGNEVRMGPSAAHYELHHLSPSCSASLGGERQMVYFFAPPISADRCAGT
jgi:hypothetical protein